MRTCARRAAHPYVSRGGVKLAAALDHFGFDPQGRACLDVGASTGGFTQVLLERGAKLVYAMDVGRGQLHESLRRRREVVSLEETDIRTFSPHRLNTKPDLIVVDVSFISLKLVLPPALALAKLPAQLVALIKPQFEAGRAAAEERHRARSAVHAAVCDDISAFVASLGWRVLGVIPSPIDRRRRQCRVSARGRQVTERLTIARLGHRGDGVADTPSGPVYVPYALPGETVTVEPVAGHPDRRHLDHVDKPSHERVDADLQAFHPMRRLRHAALVARRISFVEARAGRRGAGASRARRAARSADRRAWARPPPRGAACAARHAGSAGSRLHRAARASHRRHRPLSDPGTRPRRRDPCGLGDRGNSQADGQAARHPGDGDQFRHGRRRARLRPAQRQRARRRSPASPRNTGSRASPATANWWRRQRSRC